MCSIFCTKICYYRNLLCSSCSKIFWCSLHNFSMHKSVIKFHQRLVVPLSMCNTTGTRSSIKICDCWIDLREVSYYILTKANVYHDLGLVFVRRCMSFVGWNQWRIWACAPLSWFLWWTSCMLLRIILSILNFVIWDASSLLLNEYNSTILWFHDYDSTILWFLHC